MGVVLGRAPARGRARDCGGLVFGPVFPTLMAVLLSHCEPATHGRAVGLFFALGGLGWTTIPVAIGGLRPPDERSTGVQDRPWARAVGLATIALVLTK